MIVLMYHGIKSKNALGPSQREEGAEFYDVQADDFYAQMRWLKDSGHEALITFDDGEMNNYQLALPILKELGLTALFFVIVKRVGKDGYMGWPQLKEMVEAGMVVGSHGLSHEILTNLMDSQMEEELRASKNIIGLNLNVPVEDFSVPRGFCNDKIIQKAYDLGYKRVFISQRPRRLKSTCIPRIAVKQNWSLRRFQMAVQGKKPIIEGTIDCFKGLLKFVLREPGYNGLRKALIWVLK